MRNVHSQIIIGENFSAFIDGIPNDHECDSKGDMIYQTASGKMVYWHTVRAWAHLTTEAREPLLYKYFNEQDDPIVMGSCTCSICKQSAISQAMWL